MKVGLFFGSFNPIHLGHMIIANLVKEWTDIKEVWFIVSPQNPLKKSGNLLHEFDRYDMVERAISEENGLRVSDIEFQLPKPSYTVNTLAHLSDRYPDYKFHLIIGEDNLDSFPKWKNHLSIIEDYGLVVYPRPNSSDSPLKNHKNVQVIEAPKMDISASLIRRLIKEGKSIKYLVPEIVRGLIESRHYYR